MPAACPYANIRICPGYMALVNSPRQPTSQHHGMAFIIPVHPAPSVGYFFNVIVPSVPMRQRSEMTHLP